MSVIFFITHEIIALCFISGTFSRFSSAFVLNFEAIHKLHQISRFRNRDRKSRGSKPRLHGFSLCYFFVYCVAGFEVLLFFKPVPDIVQPFALVLEVARTGDGIIAAGEKLG